MSKRFDAIKRALDAGDADAVTELMRQAPLTEAELVPLAAHLGRVDAIHHVLLVGDMAAAFALAQRGPLGAEELCSLSVIGAKDCYLPFLRWLLDTHADSLQKPHIEGNDGRRADVLLELACGWDQLETARLLVDCYGANPAASVNNMENCALGNACRNGNLELTRFLLDRGAPPNDTANGCYASFPLISAAHKGHLPVVKLLVERGALLNALNAFGLSPLSYAQMGGNQEVIDFLRSAGALEPWQIRGESGPPQRYEGSPRTLEEFVPTTDGIRDYIGDVTPDPARPDWPILRLFSANEGTVVVTEGMSAVPLPPWEEEPAGLLAELYTHVPAGDEDCPADHWPEDFPEQGWIADWLLQLVALLTGGGERLERATLVANGEPPEPLAAGVPFTSWLLICYPDKQISVWRRPDGRTVRLFHAFPLHTAERDFGRELGIAALLRLLAESGASPLIDPDRKSVVPVARRKKRK